jgi:predicted DNA-binding transcriptional regulator YafY
VEFVYRDMPRTLDPYGLLLRDGYWYVIGHDHDRHELRTYRVDRIEGQVRAGRARSFTRPDGFDIRSVFPSDPKLLGEPESEITHAIVHVWPSRARLVAGEMGEEAIVERYDDGSIDLSVPCVNRDAFRSWLLGLTDNAVVVAPAEIRDEIVAWLSGIVEAAG